MADTGVKKIWIKLKHPNTETDDDEIRSIQISTDEDGKEVRQKIVQAFNVSLPQEYVMKMRNHRGSLIPISSNLSSNTKSVPYTLEISGIHETVKATPRSVKNVNYHNTMKDKLLDINSRIGKLEAAAPQLSEQRNLRIANEVKELDNMLQFLTKRLADAETTKWKGMFKKNPLW